MRRETTAELALLTTVVIWSLNFTAVKIGLGSFEPLSFSVVRFTIGALATVVLVVWLEGVPRFRRADLPLLLLAAFFGITLNQITFVGALSLTTAVNTSLLVGTIPIWTALVAVLARQERLSRRAWLGILIGMAGVAVIVLGRPGAAIGGGEGVAGGAIVGEVLAVATAASWAVYSVLIRPLMARYSALQVSAFVMVVGTAALVPFAAPQLARADWSTVPSDAWLALLYAALLSVTLTNILYFTAIRRVGASRAALYTYLEPFLGVLFAVALLAEQVTAVQLLGGVVVVGAIIFARSRRPPIAEPGI
ncbi:DMT family transporter [soil metagenome]